MIPLIYGSTTGNTERVAHLITECWPGEDSLALIPIDSLVSSDVQFAESVIIGVPTWNFGELQEDWEEVWSNFCGIDFHGKRVALFGLGDQLGYGDWFLDAMGIVATQVSQKGATLVGECKWQTLLVKEIVHLFRDTKTIVQTVVVPTFITPLLIGAVIKLQPSLHPVMEYALLHPSKTISLSLNSG